MNWIFFIKNPVLTVNQINRLSNVFDNAGQVVLGVVVLSPIISGFDRVNLLVIVLGIAFTIFCWLTSIWFSGKGEIK